MTSVFDSDAILFDLDGVLTPTAELHREAWKSLFVDYLSTQPEVAPYQDVDYFRYIDGKPRAEGIISLLESRHLAPSRATVTELAERKNLEFLRLLDQGITPYPGSVAFLENALELEIPVAIVSSSANAVPVLKAAGLSGSFPHIVDGLVAKERQLNGKPAPDTYLYAAQLLGADPENAVVVEDATSGVASGKAGGFGIVIGIDRGAGREALLEAGATHVVEDLEELLR